MTVADNDADQLGTPDQLVRRLGEALFFSLAIAAFMAGEIALNRPRIIFDGPFALDECLTDSIVRDPGISHSIQAVRAGVDTNPPVFHLILRGFWWLFHPIFHDSPRGALRGFSVICVWLALTGVFVMLRKAFSRPVALVGVLGVWAHPQVVEQSVTARFYAPLLLASVALCMAMQIRGARAGRAILIAFCAIALCTLHYFGIVILVPIAMANLLIDEGSLGGRIKRVLPVIAGPLALLPFLAFVHSQAAGLTVKTWLDPFSFYLARQFLLDVLCTLPLLIAIAIWSIGQLRNRISLPVTSADRVRLRIACLPMLSLVAVPLVIVVFSATVQSALMPRYAISAALALAPLLAMLSENSSRRMIICLIALLSGCTYMELHGIASRRMSALQILTGQRDELVSEDPKLPIVFADRAAAAELQAFAPELLPRISIVDQRGAGIILRQFRQYELEMSGKVAAFYPTAPLITPGQFKTKGQFHLIAPAEDMQDILLEVPMMRVAGDVYERPGPAGPG